MNPPPLPEVFGNYALKDFNEIVYPTSISWMPQTIGWKCLGLLLVAIFIYYLFRTLRQRYKNRYRREGAARLRQIKPGEDARVTVGDINEVLKIVAMAAYPREEVAGLSGAAWTRFLNDQCDDAVFDEQQSNTLAAGSYRTIALSSDFVSNLREASLTWVWQHRGSRHA